MKKLIATIALGLALTAAAFGYATFTCTFHVYGRCTTDGRIRYTPTGQIYEHYNCTCGDSGWIQQ